MDYLPAAEGFAKRAMFNILYTIIIFVCFISFVIDVVNDFKSVLHYAVLMALTCYSVRFSKPFQLLAVAILSYRLVVFLNSIHLVFPLGEPLVDILPVLIPFPILFDIVLIFLTTILIVFLTTRMQFYIAIKIPMISLLRIIVIHSTAIPCRIQFSGYTCYDNMFSGHISILWLIILQGKNGYTLGLVYTVAFLFSGMHYTMDIIIALVVAFSYSNLTLFYIENLFWGHIHPNYGQFYKKIRLSDLELIGYDASSEGEDDYDPIIHSPRNLVVSEDYEEPYVPRDGKKLSVVSSTNLKGKNRSDFSNTVFVEVPTKIGKHSLTGVEHGLDLWKTKEKAIVSVEQIYNTNVSDFSGNGHIPGNYTLAVSKVSEEIVPIANRDGLAAESGW